MAEVLRYVGQGFVYLLLAVGLGYFSDSPAYTHFPPDLALIKLSLTHGGKPKGECRRLTAEEIAALPQNMRRPLDCPRERLPLLVDLTIDGANLYHAWLPPGGWAGDGPSQVYQRFVVEPGSHRITARLRDSAREEGFDYAGEIETTLTPGQNFVIEFRSETGGFTFK